MLYNIINSHGTRISSVNLDRVTRQECKLLSDNGLFIQVCDSGLVVTDNLPLACKQYLIGAGIAVAMQAIILTIIL